MALLVGDADEGGGMLLALAETLARDAGDDSAVRLARMVVDGHGVDFVLTLPTGDAVHHCIEGAFGRGKALNGREDGALRLDSHLSSHRKVRAPIEPSLNNQVGGDRDEEGVVCERPVL